MPDELYNPDHWRDYAEEARTIAAELPQDARLLMLKVAADYDKLAERAEKRLRQKTVSALRVFLPGKSSRP